MLKKILSIVLAVVMIVSVAAFATSCGNTAGDNNSETTVADNKANDGKEFKVGFIFLHDENSTYDLNFINAVKGAQGCYRSYRFAGYHEDQHSRGSGVLRGL